MRDGEAIFVTGSRGSGKTAWTMRQIRASDRLMVWDAVGEWSRRGMCAACPTLEDLQRAVLADVKRPGRFRVGYTGPIHGTVTGRTGKISQVSNFEAFCRLAWVFMRVRHGVLVVEELADVTSSGKAPAAWGEIVRKGRHTGARVFALTQRPAESDKTIAGNADVIHTGRLSFPRDRASMAEYLDVPVRDVTALPALAWIERDMRTRQLTTGKLKF